MSHAARTTKNIRSLPLVSDGETAARYPFPPFPRGWYALAFSNELEKGKLRTVRFLGREVVLWRGESGVASAAEPYCPHLGAHLGEGGAVVGDTLRCPMHHFCFDKEGACVSTPYGTRPPPSARAKMLPLLERSGFLFTRHDPEGRAGDWELPELAREEWGPGTRLQFTLKTHVQDIAENTVDIGHFGPTHGYSEVSELDNLRTEPNYLLSRFVLHRSANNFGRGAKKIRAELSINLHGLGLYVIDGILEPGGLLTRQVFAATPLTDGEVAFRVRIWIRGLENAGGVNGLMGLLPQALQRPFLLQLIRLGVMVDVRQDLKILNRKRFNDRPALAMGDGRFHQFRAWARQFYPADAAGSASGAEE